MRVNELRQALRQAEPAAVLVSPRVMDHVIQQVWRLPTLSWHVPHRKSFVLDRHELFKHVEQEELNLEADRLLPPTVVLLSSPSQDTLHSRDPELMWLKYWRRLFHACIHLALESPISPRPLPQDVIPARIEEIGRANFEEIRHVLMEDRFLPATADDRMVYIEFASVYLELRKFTAHLVPVYFPGLADLERIDRMFAQDVDFEQIYQRTRLKKLADPVARTDTNSDESHDFYWGLIRTADQVRDAGNYVRSAILRTQAARVAPADLAITTRAAAECEIRALATRMQAALQLSDEAVDEWLEVLPALLDKADQGQWPVEAAILFDLQKVCLDSEKDIYALDLIEWMLSAGKKPIKRWLPNQRLVEITKHLRTATQRLTRARLTDTDRRKLSNLLQRATRESEDQLRARFRPVLTDAMHDAGLVPHNAPEKTAFSKVVEECLDRIVDYGYLSFGDLRDTLSRNQLKLPDLRDPHDFVRGDALIRLDRRLSSLLDGIYRPGELYLRWLERFTSLKFGTRTGRWITLFITLPLLLSFSILTAYDVVMEHIKPTWCLFPHQRIEEDTLGDAAGALGALTLEAERPYLIGGPLTTEEQTWPWVAVLAFAVVILAYLHNERFRARCRRGGKLLGRGLQRVFVDVPLRLIHVPQLQELIDSWPFQLFYGYVFKPLVLTALLWIVFKAWLIEYEWIGVITLFLGTNILLNSRPGKALNDLFNLGFLRLYHILGKGLIPGLIRLTQSAIKALLDAIEMTLHRVEEWLRFQSGESTTSMVMRTILGVLWFPIAYTARFYMVVLIEPFINPVKAPLTILMAKITYPLTLQWITDLGLNMTHGGWFESLIYWVVIFPIWYLSPDAVTFLIWEMKENWKLYQANRSPTAEPEGIGSHAETIRMLLEPGFHSGTIPKLYRKLREAEREAADTGNWRTVRAHRAALAEIEESIERFVAREMLVLLQQSVSWQSVNWRGEKVSLSHVTLASNRISIELEHTSYPDQPVIVEFELRGGWIVAGVRQQGWIPKLTPEQQHAFVSALANLYKLAGVDLVYEQVTASLPASINSYEIEKEGVVAWPEHRPGPAFLYPLREIKGEIQPLSLDGLSTSSLAAMEPSTLLFSRQPLIWDEWVRTWQRDQEGKPHQEVLPLGTTLPPPVNSQLQPVPTPLSAHSESTNGEFPG